MGERERESESKRKRRKNWEYRSDTRNMQYNRDHNYTLKRVEDPPRSSLQVTI